VVVEESRAPRLRILFLTRMWPNERRPHCAPFIPDLTASLRAAGVQCDVLVPSGSGRVLPYLRALWTLHRGRNLREYDLIHAHYGFAGLIGRLQHACPLVVTFHGSDLNPKTDDDGQPTVFGRIETALSRFLARYANGVIAVSPSLVNRMPERDCAVIPVGVNLEQFSPLPKVEARRALGLPSDRRFVLFAANPDVTVKRFALAKAAVDRVRRENAQLEMLVVHSRPHPEMALWLNAADVLLLTSFAEGSPVIVKEANACNLPIVSVPVGDVADQLRNVRPSAIVPDRPANVASAISRILAQNQRSNGRDSLDDLRAEAIASRHVAFYEAVLRSRRSIQARR
jgi:teichuronic acid biosynthesis glycosyltransferase TuaC